MGEFQIFREDRAGARFLVFQLANGISNIIFREKKVL